MNVFHKAALQSLRRSPARTVTTMAGVALSAALITAVACFVVSLQSYMAEGAAALYGGWHIAFPAADAAFAAARAEDSRAAETVSCENLGYALLEGGANPDKPYLFLAGLDGDALESLPIQMVSGRLPERSGEVAVPAHLASNGGVSLEVGDTLTLAVGVRRADGALLSQHDPYRPGAEELTGTEERTYRVVGICRRPSFEEYTAPGYTLLTAAEGGEPAGGLTVLVTLKNPWQVRSYGAELGEPWYLNDHVLRFLGLSDDRVFNTLLYAAGGILVALIMLGSVFLIYNAFHISLSERTRQMGILLSVGATQRQIRGGALFEGLCIGAVGIPAGILLGLPAIRLVLALAERNFANLLYSGVPLTLRISPLALAAAAAISLVTLLFSAYLPARRAARTPVLECIRQTDQIKLPAGRAGARPLAPGLLGLEGALALKSFRRNRGRYRSVVLSLTLSVVLFVSAGAFRNCLVQASGAATVFTTYDIGISFRGMADGEVLSLLDALGTAEGVEDGMFLAAAQVPCAVSAENLSPALAETLGLDPSGDTIPLTATLKFLDEAAYRRTLSGLGLDPDAGRWAALALAEDPATGDLAPLFVPDTLGITLTPDGAAPVAGEIVPVEEAFPDIPPTETLPAQPPYTLELLLPLSLRAALAPNDGDLLVKGLTFRAENPGQATVQLREMVKDAGVGGSCTLYNVYAMLEESRNILFIVNLFSAVFILLITLIAVANVFNTISTNLRLRRRELAMLRSVGMSDRSFRRMLRFECLFYGLRTLLFGVPLSLVCAWLIFRGMYAGGAENISFTPPWAGLGLSILGVFLIILLTMGYAARKSRGENIIDALRDDIA